MKIILALFDLKAAVYMQPFFVPAIGVAVRNLQDEIARGGEDNILARHPEDFVLYQLGNFDDESGWISAETPAPLKLVECKSLAGQRELQLNS